LSQPKLIENVPAIRGRRAKRATHPAKRGRPNWFAGDGPPIAERLLLPEDGERLTAAARESWEVYQVL
jgi:hypothetical protein